ncbi:hypothetical protein [Neolewinella litorea]|uniref:Uncharacterized protein n=1 Tax=Neolewinella litorea TaxID=2562452 RepID=A0A4S4NAF2_9BACT|nr:hypothetical protein [Neolewinella litorea]THH36294.1 hypothetical protein E4021_15400 [Neolewinella litorea]
MIDLRVNVDQVALLRCLIGNCVKIVWDINAFYFNTQTATYKLECRTELPEGARSQYDEIDYCKVFALEEAIEFENDSSKYWYKIIDTNTTVKSIYIIDVSHKFPEDKLIDLDLEYKKQNGVNNYTIGLIIITENGRIPAFITPSNFGFGWHPKFGYYSPNEIESLLNEITPYYTKRKI